jgi:hypothetical protein
MQSKRAAIIHTAVGGVAIVPSVGLAIGLTIGAADSNTGLLANLVAGIVATEWAPGSHVSRWNDQRRTGASTV